MSKESARESPPIYMTIRQAARHFTVRDETVREWVKARRFAYRMSGNRCYINIASMAAYLASLEVKPGR